MTILVTGASGRVGRYVVQQLAAAGVGVRAITRRPADFPPLPVAAEPDAVAARGHEPGRVEVVRGDLLDPASLPLAGVTGLFLFPEPRTAREVVAAAVEAGVRRIVTLSSGAVSAGLDTDFQLPVEQAVEASGCEWAHLRPGEFASNAVKLWGPSIRAERVVRWHNPDWRGLPVHEADIAAVGVAALLGTAPGGRAYDLTGPERISARDQVRAIADELGEDIRVETVSAAESREILRRQGGWAAENADFLTGFEAYSPGDIPELTTEEWDAALRPLPTVAEVTGRPARSFRQWARDHVAEFR
jgi:uncharacterized protein YbjT (DUF2867 family)